MLSLRQSRRSAALLPGLLVAAAVAWLVPQRHSNAFVSSRATITTASATPLRSSKIAMHAEEQIQQEGSREILDAIDEWRATLTEEELAIFEKTAEDAWGTLDEDEMLEGADPEKVAAMGKLLQQYFSGQFEDDTTAEKAFDTYSKVHGDGQQR
mmetsp:Transcript_52507/g.125449  ORF Transcript_52507/g.125449 Transcript_52507/m.125449 type:complete len:154 (-) Transcript_52507:123-584(-)